MSSFRELNIVLSEPQIPQNTGNIARTCAATGARLHLIKPMGFTPSDAKLKRAGLDYWGLLDITYYEGLSEFIEKTNGEILYYFSTKAAKTYSDIVYPDKAFIVFGREDAGLPESLLVQNLDSCVRIPMISDARSLNLANSVAIAAYEILRQWGFPRLSAAGKLANLQD
ncbi:MAG: tRNA (cytidine(34)-2'-O)-methyltransferase [Oscillospiraceae bacterium]|nr:tRNA (cytidine(34)-2'-O)-methyltransferase [Oscillospiraceae bacterium]